MGPKFLIFILLIIEFFSLQKYTFFKAQGIVFEAGRQYTFLLTFGLDGEEIAFSIPTVNGFNTDAMVYAPWMCGHPIKGYTTARYSNAGLEDLCWTTQNIAEGTATETTYPDQTAGERGYYYAEGEAAAACQELGPEWSVPDNSNWSALISAFGALAGGIGTSGTTPVLQSAWNNSATLGGGYSKGWDFWGTQGIWWSSDINLVVNQYFVNWRSSGWEPIVDCGFGMCHYTVRCVRKQ
ncbi:hypothetical protein AGMMS49525_11430 [Bacteroidia bacterium]|nr:hypothetical protein AGMMS49525_11430 [Bacteroidia bacterium]